MKFVIICAVFLSLTIAWLLQYRGNNQKRRLLPPGSLGLPWVGESIQFLSKWRKGRSEEFVMERVAKFASPNIFKTSLLGDPSFAVFCGAGGSKFLLSPAGDKVVTSWWPKTFDRFFTRPLQESHKMKGLALLFGSKPAELHRFIAIMDSMAKTHLDSNQWNPNHRVAKVYPLVKNFTFALACRVFMSIEDPDLVAKLEAPMNDFVAGFIAIPIAFPGSRFHRAIKAGKSMKQQLAEIVKERRKLMTPSNSSDNHQYYEYEDLIQLLLPDLSDIDMADRILGFLVGAHDTSAVVLAFIFKYLAEHPQVHRLVLEENLEVAAQKAEGEPLTWEDVQKMKYSWNVAREVMRVWTPSPGIFREAKQDFTYAGYHIPKGWKLFMSLSSIHKNPDYFAEPEKFDPMRFDGDGPLPYTYVPFGGGANMCPGRNFAQLQILVFLHNAVRRFEWETVVPNEQVILDPVPRLVQGLPLRFRPASTYTLK